MNMMMNDETRKGHDTSARDIPVSSTVSTPDISPHDMCESLHAVFTNGLTGEHLMLS
jgi:hypothetical protein